MKVIKKGDGEPEVAVVGSVHGDEPEGKKAIERFLNSDHEVLKPVKFVVANEEALEQDVRYLDVDLNRNFPGDKESENHEERLAAELVEELEDLRILDIHSTRSQPTPYAAFGDTEDVTMELVSCAGIEKGCLFPGSSGSMNEYLMGAIVEVGPQGSEEASEQAYQVLLNFLAAEGVIDAEFERTDPLIVEKTEEVQGGNWEFEGTNFEPVEEGEVFARSGTTDLVTTEPFYPVLMSTDGYVDILGYKAKKLGRASELKGSDAQ